MSNIIFSHETVPLSSQGQVIVVTHAYGDRKGVRYLCNGLKVYYLPTIVVHDQVTLPTLWTFLKLFRDIAVREQINIVHGHQAFSSLMHEFLLHARTLGLPAIFTDHSLFGFSHASNILMNKVLSFTLCDIDHVICVSYTSKENTVLRGKAEPRNVSVIPNAIDSEMFTPSKLPNKGSDGNSGIVIVVISRLAYRKGVDLLIETIPLICQQHPRVRFLVGGDGPKRPNVEEMIRFHQLSNRVTLLGEINAEQVRESLGQGHIFLNCSLTEAFCMAIVEAASCGLLVVSTNVGGIPEVLPPSIMKLAPPVAKELADAVGKAILCIGEVEPWQIHQQVSQMYNWTQVARRTKQVYEKALSRPSPTLFDRLERNLSSGRISGPLFCLVFIINTILLVILDFFWPRTHIDQAANFAERQTRNRAAPSLHFPQAAMRSDSISGT
eukprot:TRINITY_DN3961_c0_g1_i7.p1 TRINITY_DN3961_c0_g1~~TRINITY_DN3961_c0_g1_i7.p1  ORF type:complete len:439 (+),score=71.53 TRINITY_DN3961_c0_g1_i7:415-1731(+)